MHDYRDKLEKVIKSGRFNSSCSLFSNNTLCVSLGEIRVLVLVRGNMKGCVNASLVPISKSFLSFNTRESSSKTNKATDY
jgi:hypothetical protein